MEKAEFYPSAFWSSSRAESCSEALALAFLLLDASCMGQLLAAVAPPPHMYLAPDMTLNFFFERCQLTPGSPRTLYSFDQAAARSWFILFSRKTSVRKCNATQALGKKCSSPIAIKRERKECQVTWPSAKRLAQHPPTLSNDPIPSDAVRDLSLIDFGNLIYPQSQESQKLEILAIKLSGHIWKVVKMKIIKKILIYLPRNFPV